MAYGKISTIVKSKGTRSRQKLLAVKCWYNCTYKYIIHMYDHDYNCEEKMKDMV